ncbi:MAG: hypothetical protein CM15mV92_310 [Caudoviricetes sp.]|nr:MAG: hypothetical protein CM15mV92_310 [Caudoviricetes sp.]
MSYIVMSGIDVKDKRIEAGTKVTKQDLGKSFKWLLEQGIVLDEKDLERARNEKVILLLMTQRLQRMKHG